MVEPESRDELELAPTDPRPGRAGAAAPAPGERIGRFTVVELLGRGGMGVVVSARDPDLDRRVAIKLVGGSENETPEGHRRLLREARAMARLSHPNVVSVHEVGEHGGQVYVAMEQVDGGTLRAHTGGLGWREIVRLYRAAGRGLAAAHEAGLVHRDFKPDNVFVDRDGRVLVGDFGLANLTRDDSEGEAQPGDAALSERVTRCDEILGTPAYMAPEHQLGEPLDARADQFSFAVALWEALFGELPFRGQTRVEYVAAIATGSIREPADDRGIPSWLLQALRRAMAADPDDRYPSMAKLLDELRIEPAGVRRLGSAERTATIVGGGLFLLALLLATGWLDVELSFGFHAAADLTFLGFVLLSRLIFGASLARSAFNQRLYYLVLGASLAILATTLGGWLMPLTPDAVAVLHLLILACFATAGAATLEPRLAAIAAIYLVAFFVTAAWPTTFLPASLFAHSAMTALAVLIFRGREPKA